MQKIAGMHMIMDGYVKDGSVLNPDSICSLFDSLVYTLKMKYLQRPTAIQVPLDKEKLGSNDDEGGWSVICQITTSHISLHGWPLRSAFMLDVFSCKPFDALEAEDVIKGFLRVTDYNIWLVDRDDPRALKRI